MKGKALKYFIIGTFVTLYLIVSVISTIHVIDFFKLSNPDWLAISLAVAFEIGAAASLASLIALDKMNRGLVWALFITLTLMQMMGNTYYAYTNLEDYQSWVELFGLAEEEPIFQKRILSIVSGAILPLVALGFIKSLVDYIKPGKEDAIIASDKDAEVLVDAINNPPAPNAALVEAAVEYAEENDEELEYASLVDLQTWEESEMQPEASEELFSEDVKRSVIEQASQEGKQVDEEMLDYLQKSGELTEQDIQTYKEKSRIPERGRINTTKNPQILPGLNM